MKEKEKLINWSISIITIPPSSMKFWLRRTGDKSLRVKEKFIHKFYISNLISPVLRPFVFLPFRGQLRQCRWVYAFLFLEELFFKLIC